MIAPKDIAYRRYVAIRADQEWPAYCIHDTSTGQTIKTFEADLNETANEAYRRALVEAARMNQGDFRERRKMTTGTLVRGSGVNA